MNSQNASNDNSSIKESKKVDNFKNLFKKYFDAVIFLVNAIVFLVVGIPTIWRLTLLLDEAILDILNALLLLSIPILMNVMAFFLLIGRKRSAITPLLILIFQGFLFSILMFVNLLFSILLGLNAVAAIFCVKKRPLLPRFKTKNGIIIPLLMIFIIISPVALYFITTKATITLPAHTNPNFRVSFYCEFYNNDTFTNDHLTNLEAYNSRIFLAINESQIYNNSLAHNLTERLNAANVRVYAWLLLDYSEGYWAADSNVLEFENLTSTFIAWAKANNLTYEGIMIDSEPSYQRLNAIQEQIGSFNIYGALMDLRRTATSGNHEFAKERYEALVNSIQAQGYEAMVVGFPMPIDDLADGDDTLQQLMGVSTMPPYNWNYSSFMIYRSTYQDMIKVDFGSYMVYSYAKTTWNLFGTQSSISLARSGQSPYSSLDEMKKDAFIVKNMGFNEVIWISFERFDRQFGNTGLTELLGALNESKSVSFNYNPFCGYSRFLFSFADSVNIL
ncbi:MAG: hypothetical protein HWN65_01745 [Candidatus Helarchaeota archaeon]|nr:hypothetical protein [Candidatus Helarchaeota archaeon]